MDEAIETLASPDVTVTNQSDKELQLYKLRELDSLVQEAVAQCAREAVDPPVVEMGDQWHLPPHSDTRWPVPRIHESFTGSHLCNMIQWPHAPRPYCTCTQYV